MNFINIAGHLGSDPEVRFTSSGKKVTTMRVATRSRKGDTIWWRVTVWGEQFDKMISYLKKGSPVVVFGELHKPEIFNDREGKPQISMEITATHMQFSPFGKPEGQGSSAEGHAAGPAAPFGASHPQESVPNPYMGGKPAVSQGQGDTFDDEVPF
jgi:single-strand DNA-binding protein